MIISDEHRFIFVHVPKTGGTSCNQALQEVLSESDREHWAVPKTTKHESLLAVKRRIERHQFIRRLLPVVRMRTLDFQNYFKFGFVRNPWDRMVSLYHYLKKTGIKREIHGIKSFDMFIDALSSKRSWISNLYSLKMQLGFFVDSDGHLISDFIGRYENLEEDFHTVCKHLGIDATLPHLNHSQHSSYRKYYCENTRRIVGRIFCYDVDFFGYTF